MPIRVSGTRTDLSATSNALRDSLQRAFRAAGYDLATDSDLVQLLSQMGQSRRVAQQSGIGAIVQTDLVVRGGEVRAQAIITDTWRNMPLTANESADLDKPLEVLGVVRDVARALDRLSWRTANDPRIVAVFDFENMTGIDTLNGVAQQLAGAVRAAIQREMQWTVATDAAALATRDVLERREVGRRLRAGALVAGTLMRARSDSLVLRLVARDLTEEVNFPAIETRLPLSSAVESANRAIGQLIDVLRRVNWGPKAEPQP